MVYYSVSSNIRYFVYIGAFYACLGAEKLIKLAAANLFSHDISNLQFITLTGLISGAVFTIENFAWRWPAGLRWAPIPDFSGTWYGYIRDREQFVKNDECETYRRIIDFPIPVRLDIKQNFSLMGIWLTSDSGTSGCTLAGIEGDDSQRPLLRYMFAAGDLAGETSLTLSGEAEFKRLRGRYSSNMLRRAKMELRKVASTRSRIFRGTLELLGPKEVPFIGVKVDHEFLASFDRKFRRRTGRRKHRKYTDARFARDRGIHHITVIEPNEFGCIASNDEAKDRLIQLQGRQIWFELVDFGHQSDGKNSTYFVVTDSDEAQNFRREFGLNSKEFHVTLGFKGADLHDVPKGRTTIR